VDIVLRAVAIFFVLFIVTRVVGRRELSMNEPFDLILLIVIGDLVQQGITQSDFSVTGTLLALFTFALLSVGLSFINFRVKAARGILEGHPLILVENGSPLEHNLKAQRLTVGEVLAEARAQQTMSLAEIRWAILETNGTISVIPKS
jgi:uncharacterized membrane protein YcaP (DUF421 family)